MSGKPQVPFWLGFAGLLPFWAMALGRVLGAPLGIDRNLLTWSLATYAATILSFLGGIRWGIATATADSSVPQTDYVWSVLPQLAGWAALLLPDPWRLIVLALLLLALGPIDRGLVSRGLAPQWFGKLRLQLSLGAGAALFLAALA